jgi:hypothetical protein
MHCQKLQLVRVLAKQYQGLPPQFRSIGVRARIVTPGTCAALVRDHRVVPGREALGEVKRFRCSLGVTDTSIEVHS